MEAAFEIVRSRPHGHVAAVLRTARQIKLEALLDRHPGRMRDLATALIVARIINPRSKLALTRELGKETLFSSLGEILGLESADENDLYAAMDWLLARQAQIETALAKRHLTEGALVLYDLSSTWHEGRTCPLARIGHSRDGRKGTLQILFGLICNAEGCPVAVEVFGAHCVRRRPGHDHRSADPQGTAAGAARLDQRLAIARDSGTHRGRDDVLMDFTRWVRDHGGAMSKEHRLGYELDEQTEDAFQATDYQG